MVRSVTNLSRSGVADWLIQRFSAVVLAVYTFFLVGFFISHPDLQYSDWAALFSTDWMRIFSIITLLCLVAHSWIGIWGVLTDYVTERLMGSKALVIRALILGVYLLVTLAYFVWVVEILWGLK